MRRALFALVAVPLLAVAAPRLLAAPPLSPQAQWQADIAGQNFAYARKPHAMLKIQDSVYLGEGESAVLAGTKGVAASWKWTGKSGAKGLLRLSLKGGKLTVIKDGKPVDTKRINTSISVDAGVDIAGQPTQVGVGVNGWRIFVYNQKNPEALNFKGVSYFPYDPAFRLTARFVPDMKQPPIVLPQNPGLKFAPPPTFNSSSGGPLASQGPAALQNTVDCIVR